MAGESDRRAYARFMLPHALPPDPMTAVWLAGEIERVGLKDIADDPWGGEHELILSALRSGPPHRDAPDYAHLRSALIRALVLLQRGWIEEAEDGLADAIRASAPTPPPPGPGPMLDGLDKIEMPE